MHMTFILTAVEYAEACAGAGANTLRLVSPATAGGQVGYYAGKAREALDSQHYMK